MKDLHGGAGWRYLAAIVGLLMWISGEAGARTNRVEDAAVMPASLSSDFQGLVARRDALASELSKRPAEQEVLLRFDEGADRDDMWVTMRRTDGEWRQAFVEVPGWLQGTMRDWRGFYHGNYSFGCWRPNLRFPADTKALTMDDRTIGGNLAVGFKLDRPFVVRQPPGQAVQWWDKFIAGGYTMPRPVDYTVKADIHEEAALLDLVLEDGVYWDPAFVPAAKVAPGSVPIVRRPIAVRLQVPGSRFSPASVTTYTWMGGFHEADPSGLKFSKGHLTGTLIVLIHQDGWMPWGAGKHTQQQPIVITFDIDARLEHNEVKGRYTASFGGYLKGLSYSRGGDVSADVTLPDTHYDGSIRGRGGQLVAGRYVAKGDFGPQSGGVDGMLLGDPRPVREQVSRIDGDVTVARINTVLHEIRALHLALHDGALSYREAWQQTDFAVPINGGAAEYLEQARRLMDALPSPSAVLPVARPETVGSSPGYGVRAAPVVESTVNVLPVDAEDWLFLPQWHVLGPFTQRLGVEHDTALVPDLVVVPQAGYSQLTDRYGVNEHRAATQTWTTVVCSNSRLGRPGDGLGARYEGEMWYGTATLRSEKARKVWLSLEANDFAKVWVNERLVWADVERAWRYRSFGRMFVPVSLASGENRILVRLHGDRQLSWLCLAVTAREPDTPAMPKSRPMVASPYHFPEANPPFAWDITNGINVAWRNEKLGGTTRPIVVGDALFVTGASGTLYCVDTATGTVRWSRDANTVPVATGRKGKGPVTGPALSDGRRVAFLVGDTLGCFDLAGAPVWTRAIEVQQPRPRLYRCGGRLIVEGTVVSGGLPRGAEAPVRVRAFDMATGQEAWQRDLPGKIDDGLVLPVGETEYFVSATGAVLDPKTGDSATTLDCEMQLTGKDGAVVRNVNAYPYFVHASGDRLYLNSQSRHLAVRLWSRDGKVGWSHAWESNYGSSGFGNVPAPGLATDRYLFTWHSSLAHTPHDPDTRAEVNVQDTRDGRWINRRKPVMDDLYSYGALSLASPVVAGKCLYLLGGRADGRRNQIAVVSADDRLQILARQDVEPGTQEAPVFLGTRMFLRSPASMVCIAVETPAGKTYQQTQLARTALREIGREPGTPKVREVTGLDPLAVTTGEPAGKLMPERPTAFWVGAGPFPAGALTNTALAALRPVAGAAVADKVFLPVSQEYAYNEPPAYVRTSELQGTGDLTPRFLTRVDPKAVSSPTGAGLLYTVLDNTLDRVVTPALNRRGITQWLGGEELNPDEPLHLVPGRYPYLVRIDPEFYKAGPGFPVPINVTNALAKGVLSDVGWPKAWQVLGPLSPYTSRLTGEQLRTMKGTVEVDGCNCPVTSFPVVSNRVDLGCLVSTEFGTIPDQSKPFERPASMLVAVVFAAVECPADGYLYMTSSSEAFMWYVDGVPVYDKIKRSKISSAGVDAHPFAVRVTRGRHVLAAQVRSGNFAWSFCSAGGFSEKRGAELPEFKVEPTETAVSPDSFINPCFLELPHPETLKRMWNDRVREHADSLHAAVRALPGTPEARRAEEMLRTLGQRDN